MTIVNKYLYSCLFALYTSYGYYLKVVFNSLSASECAATVPLKNLDSSPSQVTQLCMMLDSLLPTLDEDTSSGGGGPSLGLGSAVIECYFLMALYWSLGATLIEESRVKFDSFVKRLASMTEVSGTGAVAGPEQIPIHYPTLYEYKFDPEQLKWVPWVDLVPEYEHKLGMKFHEILVPTVDTVRNTWLLELMVKIKRPVVFVGETGTSKTATIQNFLRGLDPDATVSRVSFYI